MERVKVESSTIKAVGYEPTSLLLEVEFKAGTVYQYKEVTPGVFDGMMGSDSKGKFFYKEIRGKYKFTKVYDPKDVPKEDETTA